MVKNTLINTLVLIREHKQTTLLKHNLNAYKSISLPSLEHTTICNNCQLKFHHQTTQFKCLLCDQKMNITESPCKVCTLAQPDYKNYEILNYERCKCQKPTSDLLQLTKIRSLSQNLRSDNLRTTASGISTPGTSFMWPAKDPIPQTTWTCKRCTLLNNPDITICEACEAPYIPDFNSNVSPSVIIKVINIVCMCMCRTKKHLIFSLK